MCNWNGVHVKPETHYSTTMMSVKLLNVQKFRIIQCCLVKLHKYKHLNTCREIWKAFVTHISQIKDTCCLRGSRRVSTADREYSDIDISVGNREGGTSLKQQWIRDVKVKKPAMIASKIFRCMYAVRMILWFAAHVWNGNATIYIHICRDIPDPNHDITNDDVIKWKHFSCYWSFVRRIHRSPAAPLTQASDVRLIMTSP